MAQDAARRQGGKELVEAMKLKRTHNRGRKANEIVFVTPTQYPFLFFFCKSFNTLSIFILMTSWKSSLMSFRSESTLAKERISTRISIDTSPTYPSEQICFRALESAAGLTASCMPRIYGIFLVLALC